MSEVVKEKQPLPWWRRILLVLVLVAMVPFIVLMLMGYLAKRQLAAEIVKIHQAGEPITFLDLQPDLTRSSTDENAARYYTEALSGIPPTDLEDLRRFNTFYRKNIISLPKSQLPGDVQEKVVQNLANFQAVLEKFDKGTDLPLTGFEIGIKQGIKVCKTRLRPIQTAILLLSLRTLDLHLQGEDDAAVNSVISMLRMARIFDQYPTMFLHSVKATFVAHACQDIYLLLEYGRPSERSLAKLQKLLSETVPDDALEKMFFAERVYQMKLGRVLMPDNITSLFLQDKVPDLPERLYSPTTRLGRLRMRRKSAQFLRKMAKLIDAARRPWPQPLDAIVACTPRSTEKPDILYSNAVMLAHITAETFALVRCTTLAVAVERYHRSHNELPGSLDDLCPDYIESIPSDPFTGKKLLYSRDGETYVVYSTGINRQDDDGSVTPKANKKAPRDWGIRLHFRETQ